MLERTSRRRLAKRMVDLVNSKKEVKQGTWKMKSAEELKFAEVKEDLKIFGEELQTKTPKGLKEEKMMNAKDDESTKKLKEIKQMARKGAKGLTNPEQTATSKGISNPLMVVMVCQKPYGIQLTNVSRVNTPGSDENRLKLYDLMYKIVKVADTMVKD
ncbi:hypothetical protein Tco_0843462 [Tanacetum coccineum]|uniref:Uncharacterized protein n=1 Tax=Tanacetum coccineum TaxID=301880 RepID=A0ABQ5B261_9ASTR